ncbi:hypothetical protein [Mobiluncus porci]|uniref:Holliday junction resolvase n=1 Tax=Mobiluncus porci TaxID=2652278 RepID=A0A7K0K6E2_9ACTO|nr:hypothetical protein [Mobiluncus porci]MST50585.1 hypothetical protein [Mobiluncus porci]
MSRNRQSAKKAGSSFERAIADYLAAHYQDDRIDRRVKHGSKDRGDIAGFRHHGQPVVIECKNTTRLDLAGWAREADIERGNDDALAGIIVHKRHGKTSPAEQWVTMPLRELLALLDGQRTPE